MLSLLNSMKFSSAAEGLKDFLVGRRTMKAAMSNSVGVNMPHGM